MMHFFILPVFLIGIADSSNEFSNSSNSDDALPVYMRGIQWNEVEKHLEKDLRLSDAVVPINYVIDLNVNLRGHGGEEISHFNGTVTVYLDIVKLVNRLIMSEEATITKISTDSERETITLHANRTINHDEKFMLQISYRGIAKMDDYGLYESWDPKWNTSLDSNGPFILASNNFPTGARFWFPCFDEPRMKATFELRVNHPSGLNVYSNTNVERTESPSDGRTLTVFEKTHLLATYQVALSVNHLAIQVLDVKGFGKVRVIASTNSHEYYRYPFPENDYLAKKFRVNIAEFLTRNLELLQNSTLEIPKDKLDVIILEGTKTVNVQPGLVTIGRSNFWDIPDYTNLKTEIRDLSQIENLYTSTIPDHLIFASLHEKSLREQSGYSSTTKQYLTARNDIRTRKASQLLKLLIRFCPASKRALLKYLSDHVGNFADIDDFISTTSKSCLDPAVAREYLEDFINQPGKAFLMVTRSNNTVTITQTRYHTTYFDRELRDNKTRYTIPIFYETDGKRDFKIFRKHEHSLSFPVSDSAFFLIDHDLEHLYFAFYEDPLIKPSANFTEEKRLDVFSAARKAMLAAYNIGYVYYERIFEHVKQYVESGVFNDLSQYDSILENLDDYFHCSESEYYGDEYFHRCDWYRDSFFAQYKKTDWNGAFNNESKYWSAPAKPHFDVSYRLDCTAEWANSTTYQRFLTTNFLGESTTIRPESLKYIALRSKYHDHTRDLHRFFFEHAPNSTDQRVKTDPFNLLAHTVLSQVEMPGTYSSRNYPGDSIRKDYFEQLRSFIRRHPQRAASMSTEIAMKLEREYAYCALPKWHAGGGRHYKIDDESELTEICKKMGVKCV